MCKGVSSALRMSDIKNIFDFMGNEKAVVVLEGYDYFFIT